MSRKSPHSLEMSISRPVLPRKSPHKTQTGSTSELLLWLEKFSSSLNPESEDLRLFLVTKRDRDREETTTSMDPERSSDTLSNSSRRPTSLWNSTIREIRMPLRSFNNSITWVLPESLLSMDKESWTRLPKKSIKNSTTDKYESL